MTQHPQAISEVWQLSVVAATTPNDTPLQMFDHVHWVASLYGSVTKEKGTPSMSQG